MKTKTKENLWLGGDLLDFGTMTRHVLGELLEMNAVSLSDLLDGLGVLIHLHNMSKPPCEAQAKLRPTAEEPKPAGPSAESAERVHERSIAARAGDA